MLDYVISICAINKGVYSIGTKARVAVRKGQDTSTAEREATSGAFHQDSGADIFT